MTTPSAAVSTSLLLDRRQELAGAAGTHALICGLSQYPDLDVNSELLAKLQTEQASVDFIARTAVSVARWLVDHADDLVAPLSTCRVLLAPSDEELVDAKELGQPVPLPNLDAFLLAAAEWRRDVGTHRDGIAFFYFGGQGYSLGRHDSVAFMYDFGNSVGPTLKNAVSLRSLWEGMAASSSMPAIARTQLFFVDTGQEEGTRFFSDMPGSRPTDVFDPVLQPSADHAAVIFNSASPGQTAFGIPGGVTFFGEALIDCLNGAAAEQLPDGWAVTTTGLARTLPMKVHRKSEEFALQQSVVVGGVLSPASVVRLSGPPAVDVRIVLAERWPATSTVSILNDKLDTVALFEPPFADVSLELHAGIYLVDVNSPGLSPERSIHAVVPPVTEIHVS